MNGFKVIGVIIVIFIISAVIYTCNTGTRVVDKWVDNSVENSISSYEEYQNIYNTCIKLNTDLDILQKTPDTDKQFEQFSKAQRINTVKTNLNRWVEDYNSKSKQKNKSLWKSSELPYQLSVEQFSNYNK